MKPAPGSSPPARLAILVVVVDDLIGLEVLAHNGFVSGTIHIALDIRC